MDNSQEYYYLSYLSNLEQKKVEKILRDQIVTYPKLEKDSRILDIGTYGKSAVLGPGKNTSNTLSENYTHCRIDGINLEKECLVPNKTNINVIFGDFFNYKPDYKYDYIIGDFSFEQITYLLESDYILKELPKILNKGGYYLQWVHRNDMSQIDIIDNSIELRKRFIKNYWKIPSPFLDIETMKSVISKKFDKIYNIEFCVEEYERDYINWFLLRLR